MSEEEYDRAAYAPVARVVSNEKEERLKKSKRWLGMQVVRVAVKGKRGTRGGDSVKSVQCAYCCSYFAR